MLCERTKLYLLQLERFPDNLEDLSKEQDKKCHQDIKTMERLY